MVDLICKQLYDDRRRLMSGIAFNGNSHVMTHESECPLAREKQMPFRLETAVPL